MGIERRTSSWSGVASLAARLVVLFCFNYVRCEIFCPPALENVPYTITAEKYDIASTKLDELKATWYYGNDVLAVCNFTTRLCVFGPSFSYRNISFQVADFGDGNFQFNVVISSFAKYFEKTYVIEWQIDGFVTTDKCQVKLGNPENECTTQTPCVNATDCDDLEVGYQCKCIQGFLGKKCQQGNRRLYCEVSNYKIVFDRQNDYCANIPIGCYIAEVNKSQQDIGLNYQRINTSSSFEPAIQPTVNGNEITFNICIKSTTPIGTYQISYQLSSARAKSDFQIDLTVEIGVQNSAPEFNTPGIGVPYLFSVPEKGLAQGAVIVHVMKSTIPGSGDLSQDIWVFDPDVSQTLGIDSLSLTVVLETQQPTSVIFQRNITSDSLGYFFLYGQPQASTNISYTLTVSDGGNGSATSRVIFSVTYVNEPPVCDLSEISVNIDIRTLPDTNIGAISCTDDDTDETFRRILYSIEGQYSSYFRVSTDGTVSMYTSLMDLQPGIFTFNVTVMGFSASPDSAYVFYKPVSVNLTVPEPVCSLNTVKVPGVWTVGSSFELRLECNISGVDKLLASPWNLVSGFDVKDFKESPTVYRFVLTLTQYIPATYKFEVMATLGGAGSLTSVVLQMYNHPKFYSDFYAFTVSDTTSVGSTVLLLSAASDVPNAKLIYRLRSGDSESIFTLYANGSLILTHRPQQSVGSVLGLEFEVQDSISNLTASSRANVTVQDTNEPPVCDQPGSVTINSSLPPDSIITTIMCHDPDKTPEYMILTYTISSEPSTVQLDIRNNGDIVLVQALPAGITSVKVFVNVSDVSLSTSVLLNITVNVIKCSSETRESEMYFPETPVNSMVTVSCPTAYSGEVTRNCSLNQTWSSYNFSNCKRNNLTSAEAVIKSLKDNGRQYSPKEVEKMLKMFSYNLSNTLTNSSTILSGDIKQMVGILSDVGDITKLHDNTSLDSETMKNFALVCDTLVGAQPRVWEEALEDESEEGARLLDAMDSITKASLRDENLSEDLPFVKENLAMKRATSLDDIVFPKTEEKEYQDYRGWVIQSNNTAFLSKKAFENLRGPVRYSVILYRNVAEKFKINPKRQSKGLSEKVLNSDILSFTINVPIAVVSPPLLLSFSILQDNYSNPSCGYLKTNASMDGEWDERGCTLVVLDDIIQCSCNHFTNFAVLMSPYGETSPGDGEVLSIISAVGCGISIFCLLVTIIVYIIVWKYVKCDRSVLNLNLSICLILAYTVFLAGVDRPDNEIGCKVVAALLHYLFLVVFFIMLSEGIEVFRSVSFVFSAESILCKLITLSYGVPLVIVAVSLGVTQTKGYGSNTYCWLSTEGGLIWAFVGPVLLILLINFIILIQVLRIMQKSQLMVVKSAKHRTKSVVRTICVLSPLLGITWVFGVLSVNQDAVVFQYLFAIFNSLQGVFIFICYCLLSHQVRDGFRALTRRYRATSFSSSQKIFSHSHSQGKCSESESSASKHRKDPRSFSDNSSPVTSITGLRKMSKSVLYDDVNDTRQNNSQSDGQVSPTSAGSNSWWREEYQCHDASSAFSSRIPLAYSHPSRRGTLPVLDETAVGYLSDVARSPGGVINSGYQTGLFSTPENNTKFC